MQSLVTPSPSPSTSTRGATRVVHRHARPPNPRMRARELEEMLVRRAIGLTSSLRVEAPVFVPVLFTAPP